MDFRTIVNIPDPGFRITYEDKLFLIGSCFASNISTKLTSCKFRVTENPFGIVYNPLSIADTLERLASGRQFAEDETAHHNGLWVSFSHHGSFSSPDRDKALERMNASFLAGQRGLEEASVVVITLGTAWVYENSDDGNLWQLLTTFPVLAYS